MKKLFKVLSSTLLVLLLVLSMFACGGTVDYVSKHKFDPNSGRIYQEVTVKLYIDGDTTHFNVTEPVNGSRTLKARYLGINTPESTGKIEEFGKAASNFTREKLSTAESIIVESDSSTWNVDSTGERVLSWVWYKPQGGSEYRLLNLELLQNGYAKPSSLSGNTYGDICTKALNQAKEQKLNIYSGKKDPDMFYGQAIELTLKELRTNIEYYNGSKVAFNAVVTAHSDNGVFVEAYDEETELYYGMYVFYGYSFNGMELLKIGNLLRVVGTVSYWEGGGTYQVAGLTYDIMMPNLPDNIQKIGEGYEASYKETDITEFTSSEVKLIVMDEAGEEVAKDFKYGYLAMNTSVTFKNLVVTDTYTTTNPDTSSVGAFTLTCELDGKTIDVRTEVLYDENGAVVKAEQYLGKTITVKGFVDYYNGSYQIKVLNKNNIIIQE